MKRVFTACAWVLVAATTVLTASAQPVPSTPVAQPIQPPTGAASARRSTSSATTSSRPTWQSLTPAQKEALRPLAGKWHTLPEERKRKWLEISKNFHALPPDEQAKMHSRMSDWVTLSQQQRTQARLNFVETKALSAEEKAAKWQAYQELSPEEKKKLAAKASAKPAGVAAVKPKAAAAKLTPIPVTRHTRKPDAPADVQPVQANTLLPQATQPAASSAP